MKRLLQMKETGASYSKFVHEQKRYLEQSNVTEEINDRMQKVFQYKKELIEKTNASTATAISRTYTTMHYLTQENFKFPHEDRLSEVLRGCLNGFILLNTLYLPNVQNANTKRFEAQWLAYLKDDLRLSDIEVVVAYNSNADAVLRFAESYPLGTVVLIDPCSLYTLGERHGRDYRYAWIQRNIVRAVIVSTSSLTSEDAEVVFSNLRCDKQLIHLDSLEERDSLRTALKEL